jgi:hypothetical protein
MFVLNPISRAWFGSFTQEVFVRLKAQPDHSGFPHGLVGFDTGRSLIQWRSDFPILGRADFFIG